MNADELRELKEQLEKVKFQKYQILDTNSYLSFEEIKKSDKTKEMVTNFEDLFEEGIITLVNNNINFDSYSLCLNFKPLILTPNIKEYDDLVKEEDINKEAVQKMIDNKQILSDYVYLYMSEGFIEPEPLKFEMPKKSKEEKMKNAGIVKFNEFVNSLNDLGYTLTNDKKEEFTIDDVIYGVWEEQMAESKIVFEKGKNYR